MIYDFRSSVAAPFERSAPVYLAPVGLTLSTTMHVISYELSDARFNFYRH